MSIARQAELVMIEGPDARAFAHAQFGSHVLALETGHWQFSAWLDPAGRVKAFFHLARAADDRLLLLLRGGGAEEMARSLQKYVLRSKVCLSAWPRRSLQCGDALAMHVLIAESERIAWGCGTHSLLTVDRTSGDSAWHLPQIRLGWPWLPDSLLGQLLPSALSLHRLGAVAIDKGCYPGQEIVARMHFRGGQKRHLHRAMCSRIVSPGEHLRIDGVARGELIDAVMHDHVIEALVSLADDIACGPHAAGAEIPLDGNLTIVLSQAWSA